MMARQWTPTITNALGFVSTAAEQAGGYAEKALSWSRYVQDLAERGFQEFEPRVGQEVETDEYGRVIRITGGAAPSQKKTGGFRKFFKEHRSELLIVGTVVAIVLVLRRKR